MYEKNKTSNEYMNELTVNIVKRKKIQSLNIFGLKVIYLRYEAKTQISKYVKLLIPKGKPTTTSFINPAIKINPYPMLSLFFKLQ